MRKTLLPLAVLTVAAACDSGPTVPTMDVPSSYSISVPGTDRWTATNGNGTVIAIAKPTVVNEGDILIAHFALHQRLNTKVVCPQGSAWTQVRSDNHGADNRPVQTLFWRKATANEPGSYDFHVKLGNCDTGAAPSSGNQNWIAGVIAYSGVDADDPIAGHLATVQNTAGTVAVAPSVDAPAGARVIRFVTEHEGTSDLEGGAPGLVYVQVRGSAAAAFDGFHTGGATGTQEITLSGSHRWIAATVALNPAATCTAPSVTTDPEDDEVTYGEDATFTAAASGDPAPTVKWQVSTDDGNTWSDVDGATSTTLTLTKPTVAMSDNQYRAVFTNSCGSADSDAATLTVNPKALTVTGITASDKPWDGNTTATLDVSGATLVGVVSGDDVDLDTSSAVGAFVDAAVGSGKTVNITGLTLTGDDAGNYTLTQPTTTASITAWYLSGFYSPVRNSVVVSAPGALPTADGSTVWNRVKAGSTVPFKFNVFTSNGGTEIMTVDGAFFNGPFAVVMVSCDVNAGSETVETFTTTGGTALRYDATEGQFIQNWATPRRGVGCYRVSVETKDGSSISAFFQLF